MQIKEDVRECEESMMGIVKRRNTRDAGVAVAGTTSNYYGGVFCDVMVNEDTDGGKKKL